MRLQFTLFCLLLLTLWGLRLGGLHPAFQADDSPETAAASATLGIQHPPGYPLPTLLGRVASLALPGAPAFAQNLAASAWACLAAGLFFLALNRLSGEALLSAALALGFGLMPQLGFQGGTAKGGIYTLNLALTLGSLLSFWQASQGSRSFGRLGWLLLGLGLAGHYMSLVLFAPAFIAWSWRRPKTDALWILPGLSLYLYLPLRASLGPAMNWGAPSTLTRFVQAVTRAQYSALGTQRGLANSGRLAARFLSLLSDQLPWWLWPCLLLGLWLAYKSRSWSLKPLILALALHLAAVLIYNNPPADASWVADAFFLPDFALLWFFAGLGLWSLTLRYSQARVPILAGAWALVLAVTPAKLRQADHSGDYLNYDYSHELMDGLPKDAVLLAAGGADAFGFWYLQQVEGKRPDLTLLDVPLLSDWYLAQLWPRIPGLKPEWRDRDSVVGGLLSSALPKPLYYSSHNPGDRGIPFALVSLAPAPGAKIPLTANSLAAPWLALRCRFLGDASTPMDGARRELMGYYASSAQALKDMAARVGSQPLAQFASRMQARFQRL